MLQLRDKLDGIQDSTEISWAPSKALMVCQIIMNLVLLFDRFHRQIATSTPRQFYSPRGFQHMIARLFLSLLWWVCDYCLNVYGNLTNDLLVVIFSPLCVNLMSPDYQTKARSLTSNNYCRLSRIECHTSSIPSRKKYVFVDTGRFLYWLHMFNIDQAIHNNWE